MSIGAAITGSSMEFHQEIKNGTYDPAIPLLCVYPKETKRRSERGTCSPIISAFFFLTKAKTRKQAKCLPVDEWIKKIWCI